MLTSFLIYHKPNQAMEYSFKRKFYPDLENTVQAIISSKEPNTKPDSLDKIFSDKTKILKATVKQIFNEINLRGKVNSEIITSIDQDICKCHTYLQEIRTLTERDYSLNLTIAFDKRRTQIESELLDLEKQQRQEILELWRDLMFLKKYLMSALTEYWTLSNRKEILASDLTENEQ